MLVWGKCSNLASLKNNLSGLAGDIYSKAAPCSQTQHVHFVLHPFICAQCCFACITPSIFMECKHKRCVEFILCQNVFDISPSLSNKAKEALCYIGSGEDIDMAFWWHYRAGLISPYCVVTASNHTSSLAWGEALNAQLSWCTKFIKG